MLPGTLLFLHPVSPALRLLHYLRGRVVRGRLGVVFFGVHGLVYPANGSCRFIGGHIGTWPTVPPVTVIHLGSSCNQDDCLYSRLESMTAISFQSLKSPFAFSHPEVEGSNAATRSTSLVFKLRDLSVQSSNIVARLNNRVCEEKPRSTKPSSISRPCNRLVGVRQSEQRSQLYLFHSARIEQAYSQIYSYHLIVAHLVSEFLPC